MSLLDAFLLESHRFEVWIAKRTDGALGSGTADDPYNGSTAALFDSIMSSDAKVPAGSHVHLGPGIFDTSGFAVGVTGGWQAKSGLKLEGGGIGVTTLRLANATAADKHYYVVGHALNTGGSPVQPNRVDHCSISDLTIDCSLGANGNGNVACGGVRLMGHHCRIERVKVINWGTKTLAQPCYVLAVITADPPSNVMEVIDPGIADCIVVEPGPSIAAGTVTLLHAGGLEAGATVTEGYGLSPFIRNCFVDGTTSLGAIDLNYEFRGL